MTNTRLNLTNLSTPIMFFASLSLCFVPLFNVLGFEFCFAATCLLTLSFGCEYARQPLAPKSSPFVAWQHAIQALVKPLAALLLPVCINGFFVTNCNWGHGLALFGLLTVWGGILAAAVAVSVNRLTRFGATTFALVWFGVAAIGLARFYLTPQVDVFTYFAGYYPGAIYDEGHQDLVRLFWSRIEDTAIATSVLCIIGIWRRKLGPRSFVIVLFFALGAFWQAEEQDLRRDETKIQERLGGRIHRAPLTIFYPRHWSTRKAERLMLEMHFLLQESQANLELKLEEPVDIYFYQSIDQKKRLMGARYTRIAKPWQLSFHVDSPKIGQSVLKHELLHLLAATFGSGPLKIATNQFGVPNMGLTEGLAEAFSPRSPRFSVHEWTAALDKLGKRPDIESLLSPDGFYNSAARTAYTVCGSLLTFASTHYGVEMVKEWYRTGYPPPPYSTKSIINSWSEFLNQYPLSPQAQTLAETYFARPSIFKKTCAHEMASMREKVTRHIRWRAQDDALHALDEILKIVPLDRWAVRMKISQLVRLKRFDDARVIAERVILSESMSTTDKDRATEWLADINGLSGDIKKARRTYETLLEKASARADIRRLTVKKASSRRTDLLTSVLQVVSLSQNSGDAAHSVEQLYRAYPEDEIAIYLRLRQLIHRQNFIAAVPHFLTLRLKNLPTSLRLEVSRMQARMAFDATCFTHAMAAYRAHLGDFGLELTEGEKDATEEWLRRSTYFAQHASSTLKSCPLEIDNLYSAPHIEVPGE